MRLTGLWPLVNGFQAHQAANTITARLHAIPRQPGRDLAAAEERVFREQLVDRVGFATDISSEMIAIVREKVSAECCANIAFEVARADVADWPDGTFDVVLGFNVLHLVAVRDAVLQNVCRLLKPGGLFISKTPCLAQMGLLLNVAVPVMQAFGKASYVAFFSGADLEREIAAANFEISERARHESGGKDTRPFLWRKRGPLRRLHSWTDLAEPNQQHSAPVPGMNPQPQQRTVGLKLEASALGD